MVSPSDIRTAKERINGRVIRTPLVYSPTFSEKTGCEVYLKLENMQKAGSFKVRGATNKILSEQDSIRPAGVIAASAGNHAQGVAVAARTAGVSATIIMPEWVSLSKQEASVGYGARVILNGKSLEESIAYAIEMARDEDMTFIHPYDDDAVIAGQGTIGLEIMEDCPDVDLIVVPVGGGGLIAGIAVAVHSIRPEVRIAGVQAEACPSAPAARREGRPVTVEARPTIADGIRVKRTGVRAFPIMEENVKELVLVDEDEMVGAVLELLERKKVLAEGAGVAGLAALLSGKTGASPGSRIVVVISGGNVDTFLLERILRRGLFDSSRMMQFSVYLEDTPRSLPELIGVVTAEDAVITGIDQARSGPGIPLNLVQVTIEVEIRGPSHQAALFHALREAGYTIAHGSACPADRS